MKLRLARKILTQVGNLGGLSKRRRRDYKQRWPSLGRVYAAMNRYNRCRSDKSITAP